MSETKPCVYCGTELESAVPDDMPYQPYRGGEITFSFSYGSCKWDHGLGWTRFFGVVCDDCAAKYIPNMDRRVYDSDGVESENGLGPMAAHNRARR